MLLAVLPAFAVACGESSAGDPDAGTIDQATQRDLAFDPPTLILAGDVTVHGLTIDDKLIIEHNEALHSLDPNRPDAVAAMKRIAAVDPIVRSDHRYRMQVDHKTFFLLALAGGNPFQIGTLTTFTDAAGPHEVTTSAVSGFYGASEDGNLLWYSTNGKGQRFDIAVDTAAHDAARTVVTGLDRTCFGRAAFADGRLVAMHCLAGERSGTLASYEAATGNATTLLTRSSLVFDLDAARGRAVAHANTDGVIVDIVSGMKTFMSPDFVVGHFTPDGTAVLYRNDAHGLLRFSIGAPAQEPVLLQPANVGELLDISPTGDAVVYRTVDGGSRPDIVLTRSNEAAPPIAVLATGTYSAGFTRDGAFAFAASNPLIETGNFRWVTVAGGAVSELPGSVSRWLTAYGARVIYYSAGVMLMDLSDPDGRRVLAPQGSIIAGVSHDGRTLFYTIRGVGLYSVPIP